MSEVIFVSGIHTDAGKSYATGWLASQLIKEGRSVITQKFVQTGNCGLSEDIDVHRSIMGLPLLERDLDHTTAPVIFSYPCSPQLAAEIDGREIDLDIIDRSTSILASEFDVVLIEGAGGLMVPLTDDFFTIDYISSRNLPLILVTNGSLGSINHTILSLEAVKARGIKLHSVIYNTYFDSNDSRIAADTFGFISRYLAKNFPGTPLLSCPSFE